MIDLSFKNVKASFFDRQKVKSAVDRATRRVLSKFGAFVMRRARTSIRKRKKASDPGQPPSSHVGTLRKGIFFAFVPPDDVIIGPVLTNQSARGAKPLSTTVPSILERGGFIAITRKGKTRRAKVEARPFMKPAFDDEKKNLMRLWAGAAR